MSQIDIGETGSLRRTSLPSKVYSNIHQSWLVKSGCWLTLSKQCVICSSSSARSVVMRMQEWASERIIYFTSSICFFKTSTLAFPGLYSGTNVAVFQQTKSRFWINLRWPNTVMYESFTGYLNGFGGQYGLKGNVCCLVYSPLHRKCIQDIYTLEIMSLS